METVERAILVGLETAQEKAIYGKSTTASLLDELEELAKTAGAEVVHKVIQRRERKDPGFLIGRGKAMELSSLRQELDCELVIFDDELTGSQIRNLEEVTGARVIDRSTLILDIFAQRAKSREGKLQVELAQLKYRLPRLTGLGNQLSRLGGGIGTRGPGEKKLEVDRRHIHRRISRLERELEDLGKRRELVRAGRRKNDFPVIAVVGYTNAGKSTLINALCHTDVFAEDKLFATLDPSVRKLVLPDGREVLLIDTVGFIRKLPHDLVEAFKSTLEEAVYADALLHVVDASAKETDLQIEVVNQILGELGVENKPSILVLNKIDRMENGNGLPRIHTAQEETFEISALTGAGLENLVEGISRLIPVGEREMHLLVPYFEGWVLPYIHQFGTILTQEYIGQGIELKARIRADKADKLGAFLCT